MAWLLSLIALLVAWRQRWNVHQLRVRVEELEKLLAERAGSAPGVSPPVEIPPTSAEPDAPAQPIAAVQAVAPAAPVASVTPPSLPPLPPHPVQLPATWEPAAASLRTDPEPARDARQPEPAVSSPRGRFDWNSAEEWVGGVWLQNAGSVLLLLGVLFLILWGYSTGRFGPGVLVAAGIVLGATIAWRGDRFVPALPAFGFAVVGIGVGTVYLTLCLGHFHLHVLGRGVALVFLAVTSTATIVLGQRYRSQYFAILGVIGAHLPPLLGRWAPLTGFAFPAPELVGYLAAVNLVVYVLAWRSGWSALNLAAVALTTGTWIACVEAGAWTWPTQVALTALYLGLGLAPIPFLRRVGQMGPMQLGVVAAAPLGLVLASSPFVLQASGTAAGTWSGILFLLYAAASWWADPARAQGHVWRVLTAAATLFLTVALERAIGEDGTPIAWSLEGLLLVVFGLRSQSGWLRMCGYVVQFFAATALLGGTLERFWLEPGPPLVGFFGLRALICSGVVALGAHLLGRERSSLGPREQYASEIWTVAANLLFAGWVAGEARNVSRGLATLDGTGTEPGPLFPFWDHWLLALTGFGWSLQAAGNAVLGIRRRSVFLLGVGHGLAVFAFLCVAGALALSVPWSGSPWPVWFRSGLTTLAAVMLFTGVARLLADRRGTEVPDGSVTPEAWTLGACVLWIAWIARLGDRCAYALGADYPSPELLTGASSLSLAATALGWAVMVVTLMRVGFRDDSRFLRTLAHLVGALLLGCLFLALSGGGTWHLGLLPILHPSGLFSLLSLTALSGVTIFIWKRRPELSEAERRAPEVWLAGVTLIWMAWWFREATHVDGIWSPAYGFGEALVPASALRLTATGFGWLLLAVAYMRVGLRRDEVFVRACATAVAFSAMWVVFISLFSSGTWRPGAPPILHPSGVLSLGALLLATYLTASLRSARDHLREEERRAPNFWAAAASVVWMAWTAREAGNAARFLVGVDDAARVATLAAALTSAGWLLQSIVLVVIGWFRNSAFLRWAGLLLLGATVVKFLFHDLRTVDLFWRFLTAALVGAALLAISYAYQKRRARSTTSPAAPEPPTSLPPTDRN